LKGGLEGAPLRGPAKPRRPLKNYGSPGNMDWRFCAEKGKNQKKERTKDTNEEKVLQGKKKGRGGMKMPHKEEKKEGKGRHQSHERHTLKQSEERKEMHQLGKKLVVSRDYRKTKGGKK